MHTLTRAGSAARPALLGFERSIAAGLLPFLPGTAVMAAPRARRLG